MTLGDDHSASALYLFDRKNSRDRTYYDVSAVQVNCLTDGAEYEEAAAVINALQDRPGAFASSLGCIRGVAI